MDGIFREPGIFQAYLITAMVLLRTVKVKFRNALAALIVVTFILTFSSIGYPLAIVTAIYIVLAARGRYWLKLVVIVLALVGSVALWSFQPLDYEKKIVEIQGTQDSRVTATTDSFAHFVEHPIIGSGLFVDQPGALGLEGVSLISSVHMFGVVGIALYLLTVVLAIRRNYQLKDLGVLIPLLGTSLLSQPLYFDAITLFFLSLNTSRLIPTDEPLQKETPSSVVPPCHKYQEAQQSPY
jgi:hypothetical protein